LVVFVGKKWKQLCKFKDKYKKQQKKIQNFEITNLKEFLKFLMNRNLKIILIIPTLNTLKKSYTKFI